MTKDMKNVFDEPSLLTPPVKRAAYSNRTAWLMSAMSQLAYYPFEDVDKITKIATELAEISEIESIKKYLENILGNSLSEGNKDELKKILNIAGFELINTYNHSDTQAFLARKESSNGDGMLVLAFRGTEMNPEDIHTDANAILKSLNEKEKVHTGFYNAFKSVEKTIRADLKEHQEFPLYITGHSLGGALAILATRLLAPESLGACYTFGNPRVGNHYLEDNIKTPIYRIVNAADIVPRLPPSYFINVLIAFSNLFHLSFLATFFHRFKGYVHYGDMRYLDDAPSGLKDNFPKLILSSNPSSFLRLKCIIKRWLSTSGKAAITDHSIELYRKKLKAYALKHVSPKKV